MITEIIEKHSFSFAGARVNLYSANAGEGLPKHQHTWPHSTMCCAGKIVVRKENLTLEMTVDSAPIILKENEWHEIEALEDNTVFINTYTDGKY